jgi:hypothetical protein
VDGVAVHQEFQFEKGERKLQGKFLGPFLISETIGANAAKLDLPDSMNKLHPVFHISLLNPYCANGRGSPG